MFFVCVCLYLGVVCGHEMGHWLAAHLVGFHASTFTIGQGRPFVVLGKVGDTEVRLTPWLVGGAVHVEELSTELSTNTRPEFAIKQILVLAAGPITSFVIGVGFAFWLWPSIGIGELSKRCVDASKEMARAIGALLSFRNLNSAKDEYDYYTFLYLPWMATSSMRDAVRGFCSTALSEGLFNILPVPILDGGKITFALWWLITRQPISADTETMLLVVSYLALMVMFFACLYRGYKFPFPR